MPRTAFELSRIASRIERSLKMISCWTNCQSTYFQIAIGIADHGEREERDQREVESGLAEDDPPEAAEGVSR